MAEIDLRKEINAILKDYTDEVAEVCAETIPDVAEEAADTLKKNSPHRRKGKKKYATGWKVQTKRRARIYTESVIYNRNMPGLTHLLEYGHAKTGGGRVAPRPHIAAVADAVEKELLEKLEAALK